MHSNRVEQLYGKVYYCNAVIRFLSIAHYCVFILNADSGGELYICPQVQNLSHGA
jgi:hypothetical protein